jgi:hypothetical protein
MPLDTNIPSWLQRNWAPRESFDPTPWLQEQYRRKIVEAELPGRIQAQALENQQRLMGIKLQAQQQELFSKDLASYHSWLETVGTDPAKIINSSPQLLTPQAQQLVLNQKKMASENQYLQAWQANHNKMAEAAAALTKEGFPIAPTIDDPVTGGKTFDPTVIAEAGAMLAERKRKMELDMAVAKATIAESAPTAAVKNTDALIRAKKDYEAALASKDQNAIADSKFRFEELQAQTTPPSESTTSVVDPATGQITVTTTRGRQGASGKSGSDLTVANQTKVQAGLSDSLKTIDVASRLIPLLDTETVGAQAFAESWVKDRILAQRFPELASSKRADAEVLTAQLRSSTVRELRSDGNISDKERDQILKAVPGINDPIDSPARAVKVTQAIREMSAIHAIVSASKLGQSVPTAAAQVLKWTDLERLVKSGVLTPEQALAAFDSQKE